MHQMVLHNATATALKCLHNLTLLALCSLGFSNSFCSQCVQYTPNELHSTTVRRIRSINAEWMRLHNLCCGEQSPTKLTAVIFNLYFCLYPPIASYFSRNASQVSSHAPSYCLAECKKWALKQCMKKCMGHKQRRAPNESEEKWDNEEKMEERLR